MNFSVIVLPLVIFIAFTAAFIKKVGVYDCFISGVNELIPLLLSIFPYLVTLPPLLSNKEANIFAFF